MLCVLTRSYPFKIIKAVVVLVSVLMIDLRFSFRIWYKGFCEQFVNASGASIVNRKICACVVYFCFFLGPVLFNLEYVPVAKDPKSSVCDNYTVRFSSPPFRKSSSTVTP